MDYPAEFLKTFLWPVPHLIEAYRLSDRYNPPAKFTASPLLDMTGAISTLGANLRHFILAIFCVYGLYSGDDYPGFGAAKVWSLSWMWPIIARNFFGTLIICGLWDWWLYFGPMKGKLFNYKIIKRYPTMRQMCRDAVYTTLASCSIGLIEIWLCHGWATQTFPMTRSLYDKPFLHCVLILTLTYWRTPHLHFIHRLLHPWKTEWIPDVGKFLYRHIHSIHHKSYNMTAFSGMNNPFEAAFFFTAALMVVPLGVHPCIVIACFLDIAIGAWLGHDGFGYPGSGDYFHILHHMHFDCNYGAPHVPLDYLFGTFAGSDKSVKAIWGKIASGKEANETTIYSDSPSGKVE